MPQNLSKNIENQEMYLTDLLNLIWIRKFYIILITIIFGLLGICYEYKIKKVIYNVSIDLEPLKIVDTLEFNNLKKYEFYDLTSYHLMEIFWNYLNKRDIISDVLVKYDFADKNIEKRKLKSLANNIEFEIKSHKNKLNGETNYIEISMSGKDYLAIQDLFINIIDEIDVKVKKYVKDEFNNLLNNQIAQKKIETENIRNEISKLTTEKNLVDKNRLIYLKEQLEIAKLLEINKGIMTDIQFVDESFEDDLDLEVPYYFRGYIALKKEIEFIKNKKNNFNTRQIIKLKAELDSFHLDTSLEKVMHEFNNLKLLNDPYFKTISYNEKFLVSSNQNPIFILIFSIMGLIISISYFFLKKIFNKIKI